MHNTDAENLRAFGFDPIAHMNKAKARKVASGGRSYVKTYKTTAALERARGGNVGPGTWEYVLGSARAKWECARVDAIEQFRFDVFGHEWEGI